MARNKILKNECSETGLLISLVISCYNEIKVIEKSLLRIREILRKSRCPYELIIIDDASTDGTQEKIKRLIRKEKNEKYFFHEKNCGRGNSVSEGIRAASGEIVGFIDVDLEIDATYIPLLAREIEKGADISTAWRIYRFKLNSIHRQLISKIYIKLIRFIFNVPLRDTETGCKFFKREKILPILLEIKDGHWFWDTEVMIRSYFKGLDIKEVPSEYIRKPETGTTVKIIKDVIYYIIKVASFYREMKIVKDTEVYQRRNEKKINV